MEAKKNPIAAMIIARAKPQNTDPAKAGEGEGAEDENEGNQEGRDAAAEDIMQAIKNGDAKMLSQALQSFCQMCDED